MLSTCDVIILRVWNSEHHAVILEHGKIPAFVGVMTSSTCDRANFSPWKENWENSGIYKRMTSSLWRYYSVTLGRNLIRETLACNIINVWRHHSMILEFRIFDCNFRLRKFPASVKVHNRSWDGKVQGSAIELSLTYFVTLWRKERILSYSYKNVEHKNILFSFINCNLLFTLYHLFSWSTSAQVITLTPFFYQLTAHDVTHH
jgi:hypothetical protein